MSLLIPETGLLIWMLLTFGVVVFVLGKFGFPVIVKMVENRKAYIEDSLFQAQKARDEVDRVKKDIASLTEEARKEHAKIIQEAQVIKENILDTAKEKAYAEASKIVQEARQQILNEKEQAMLEVRKHMVDLTVEMTEKVLRKNLEKKQDQSELIRQLLKDVESSQS